MPDMIVLEVLWNLLMFLVGAVLVVGALVGIGWLIGLPFRAMRR